MPLLALTDDQLQAILDFLVTRTIDPNEWDVFLTDIGNIKDSAGGDAAKRQLIAQYLPSSITPDDVAVVADAYCDQVYAGVDTWGDAVDQLRWVQVCQLVTELTSSVQ
jgi:hypothetical protein